MHVHIISLLVLLTYTHNSKIKSRWKDTALCLFNITIIQFNYLGRGKAATSLQQ